MNKILVIDDEEIFRQATICALERRGFEMHEAGDGVKGAEVARKVLPDLIVCDVNMDKLDGYGLLEELRQDSATAGIPFILMTGLNDAETMRRGMNLGADDYLAKPFNASQLYSAVEARLRKHRAMRETAERKLADLRANLSLALPHEMITPLNGIFGLAEILKSDSASLTPAEVAEYGTNILESAERLHRTVQNFLLYGKLELQASDPAAAAALQQAQTPQVRILVETRARHQASRYARAADLQLDLADGWVAVGQELLSKLVDELVDNSFKFSRAGTPVKVCGAIDGRHYQLAVGDEGPGMEPAQVARIGAYAQFNRSQNEQQGSGLGLAIARQITELHQGQFNVQSQKGLGTTVIVKLPQAAMAP